MGGTDFFSTEIFDAPGKNVSNKQWKELEQVNTCGLENGEFDQLYGSKEGSRTHNSRFMNAVKFTTDQHYKCPAVRYESQSKKVFRYNMGVPLPEGIDYDITLGGSQDADGLVRHSENLPFYWSAIPEDKPQYAIGQGVKYYYANFIRFG